ncbi:MAG: M23 family metallopeptidase [Hamadaea sp.]|uniref:murein hydrolase activator EnvC family protein n=1 Tax=Hamadaea sp. TaxID=2024425 RepID=UPI0017A46579|nr:M23 family metallopeptidase [Hamadaea sp.]NUR70806.1 M23 family metallopeptidase [Hamadaea sp.]NUT20161.1 M23 family metallopeptidase [Hamadaea sp.]
MRLLPAILLILSSVLPPVPSAQFGWPLPGTPTVTRRFDPPPEPWLPGHRGVDLAGSAGEVVRTAGAGRVTFAGMVAGRGVVSVAHADGVRTTYEPVTPTTTAGAVLNRGDSIGRLDAGHPGCPITWCLHWGARRGETYLDPLSLLGLGRIRLKPLHLGAAPAVRPPAAARPRRSRRRALRRGAAHRLPRD